MSINDHYTYDKQSDLWISNDGTVVDYRDGSEDYLTEVFSATGGTSVYPIELKKYIKDWPSRYHLSHRRANLLEGVKEILGKDNTKDRTVFELGAGTGSITRWLADNFAHVDSIEGNLPRAKVNRQRTAGLANVRLLVGDMLKAPFPENVDVVAQIGSLEYVPAYQDGDPREACISFLDKVRQTLAPDGSYVLAIENRLGLKYWAGCGEDHTGGFGEGLVGYPNKSAVTFSRTELESILRESGFQSLQFYHLFPDYKLTSVLMRESDETLTLNPHHWFRGFAEDYMSERLFILPDQVMLETLVKDKMLWHFSNSFLVVCSTKPNVNQATDWLIKKFSNSGRPELHHTITLAPKQAGGYLVKRQPLREGQPRIDLGQIGFTLADADYIAGDALTSEAYAALLSKEWQAKITALAQETKDELVKRFGSGDMDQDGYLLVDGAALDFAFWNLIRTDNGLEFIDKKWAVNHTIPADYVIWRNLFWLFYQFGPFLKDKDIHGSVDRVMRDVFPDYKGARQDASFRRENEFQSLVYEKPSHLERYFVDAFDVRETVARLQLEVTANCAKVREQNDAVKNLQADLDDIHASRAWKVVSLYRRLMERLSRRRTNGG